MSYVDLRKQAGNPPAAPTGFLRVVAKIDGSIHFTDEDGVTVGPVLFAPMIIPAATELTIATGVITPTTMHHAVDTESDAASDELDTITAPTSFPIFNLLILRPEDDARSVVIKHNVGNIILSGSADITLDDITDHILLFYDGTQWVNLQ
jgi:hypothetical protein